jgi:hypothetical protein
VNGAAKLRFGNSLQRPWTQLMLGERLDVDARAQLNEQQVELSRLEVGKGARRSKTIVSDPKLSRTKLVLSRQQLKQRLDVTEVRSTLEGRLRRAVNVLLHQLVSLARLRLRLSARSEGSLSFRVRLLCRQKRCSRRI